MTGFVGAGKHVWDPSVPKDASRKYLLYLWMGQFFNLTAMALLNCSICMFLVQLRFSRSFRILIWASPIVHMSVGLVFPYIIFFGECTPVSQHWNLKAPGHCWSAKSRVISGKKTEAGRSI